MAPTSPNKRARYYDGVTAEALDVAVRPSTLELVISRAEGIVPPLARGDERLMVEDAELRRQIGLAVPQLAGLGAAKPSAGGRIAIFGTTFAALLGLFWVGIDYGSEYAAGMVPYPLQARLGNSVMNQLIAGHQICTNPAGLAAINGLADRLAKAADYGHPVKGRSMPSPCRAGSSCSFPTSSTRRMTATRWRVWWRTRWGTPCTIIR